MRLKLIAILFAAGIVTVSVSLFILRTSGQIPSAPTYSPSIPKTWDDAAMATLEVPLANPIGSPKHVPASYYYRIPVRPIYKSYPIYAPGHEPPGYMDWLKRQKPQIIWGVDPNTGFKYAPPLKTEEDWINAGEIVFDSQQLYIPILPAAIFKAAGVPFAANGVAHFIAIVIRQQGKIEVGFGGCVDCHTRVMPNGSVLKGTQGNIPIDRGIAFAMRGRFATAKDKQAFVESTRLGERALFEVPWLNLSDQPDYNHMSVEEIAATHAAIPGGVLARQGTSVLYPPHIPDLIGVRDRHFLDATGLEQQRGIVDLMRYAALNQGGAFLASFDDFIPAGGPSFRALPGPDRLNPLFAVPDRYSDEQLYALALYVYSLKPPPNPNKFDALAARGKKVFERERCAMCHTPPLYTNNKLTLAEGFTPPPGTEQKYDIMPISVGTDPGLALKTRRGTGYYKVPSLRGVWYRSMFGHSGWCATLEDWFNPARLRSDYVPTGFKPYGAKTYAVKGHPFGLDLDAPDKKALIAFLKTL